MNRRAFFLGLGSLAAAHRVLGYPLETLETADATPPSLELRSGKSRLALVPGERGYGLALYTMHENTEHLAAKTETPVRMFYGVRAAETVCEIAFARATADAKELAAGAEFTDLRGNRWTADFWASACENEGFRCRFEYRLVKGAAANFFFEHPFRPATAAGTQNTYVLMPGLIYDGNRLTVPSSEHQIPQLTAAENFTVDTPVLTLATPMTALQDKRTGLTFLYVTEATTDLDVDMAGFRCVAASEGFEIATVAPCYREKHYHHNHYNAEAPKGAHLSEGGRFSVKTALFAAMYPDRLALFRAVEPVRQFVRTPFERDNRLPLSAAARLVEENLNTRQWCEKGFYANAMMPEFDIAREGCCKLTPGWQLLNGWCAGPITGYALLKVGDEMSRARARKMFDVIATGISPSGLSMSVYACGKWDSEANNSGGWQHMRMPADVAFYTLKALELESGHGTEHPEWRRAAVSNLDAFVRLWQAHEDFGWKVDRNTLAMVKPGTAAGALCIGGLALGAKLEGGGRYLQVACESADAYFDRCVREGWIVAGPLDIPNAPDSESATALLESFTTLYEATRDAKYLNYAQETAYQLATWVVAYNAKFPAGTICARLGIQSTGGVLANAQNHHIGPSFCTNSGSALLRLYEYTGEARWLRLLEDTITGLPQYVCTPERIWRNIKPGMVTEQFDMSDELGNRGDASEVSACWPATCVLLSYGELPSVYVDAQAKTVAVFDQIAVNADWAAGTLHVRNPTEYHAKIRIAVRNGAVHSIRLAPSELRAVGI